LNIISFCLTTPFTEVIVMPGYRIPGPCCQQSIANNQGTMARTCVGSSQTTTLDQLMTYAQVFGPKPQDLIYEEQEIFGPARRSERHPYGPTNERRGSGGFLEYNMVNRRRFVRYFNPQMPSDILPQDLLVLSSTWTRRYPRYRILPPSDLWQNMACTLQFLEVVLRKTGVTVGIQSAYRSGYINNHSGGARSSQHLNFSALDLSPISNVNRFRIYLEHYWWEHGNGSVKLGLGLYNSGRTHIDTNTRSNRARWPEGRGHSRAEARQRFGQEFGTNTTLES